MYSINNFQCTPTKPIQMGIRGRTPRVQYANRIHSPAPSVSSQEVRLGIKKFFGDILDGSYFPKKPRVISKSKRKKSRAAAIYEQRKHVAQRKTQNIEEFIPEDLETQLVEFIHGSDTSKKKELEQNSLERWSVRDLLMNLIQGNRNKEAALAAVDQVDLTPIKRSLSG